MGRVRGVLAIACVSAMLTACSSQADPAPSTGSSTSSVTPVNDPAKLTFGVWGNDTEIAAYDSTVSAYNASTDLADVTTKSWPSDDAMVQDIESGAPLPDVFLISRGDLEQLWSAGAVEPVDDYLDARAVDLGDEYSRAALEAFSAEHRLQCMPYGVSPQVVYYNTDLVDFPRMEATGLEVPGSSNRSWSWDEFNAAAEFASTARKGARAFWFDQTLTGIAPFVLAGGGKLVNDDQTSLAFSDDSTRGALGTALGTLRNAALTLTPQQLAKRSPLDWFKRGRLGMIAGDRSLVPELRQVKSLHFDVLPFPSIDHAATVGDFTGLCLSKDSKRIEDAADLLVALSSDQMMTQVAQTGYLVPVNQQVALSQDFLQPLEQPLHADVYSYTVRNMTILPLTHEWDSLQEAVAQPVHDLFADGPTIDLDALTTEIDETSRTVLPQPSETSSASPEE
ncbi:ABC transporter substrate-binding protein [Nocardioides sp.]|uniref:ABC transporter substrate-binding protein n=1 Tax=Nocardioides sp. TaxID=35761 RepID=UPI0039E33C54